MDDVKKRALFSGTLLLACYGLALVSPHSSQGQSPRATSGKVQVVNTVSNPVPVDVINKVTSPVFVENYGVFSNRFALGDMPFSVVLNKFDTEKTVNFVFSGRRLLIQDIEVDAEMPTGQLPMAAILVFPNKLDHNQFYNHHLVLTLVGERGNIDFFSASELHHLYSTNEMRFTFSRSGETDSAECHFLVTTQDVQP